MKKSKFHSTLMLALIVGLALAACTRPASTAPVPTETPAGGGTPGIGIGQPIETDPTMAALGTQVAGSMTGTAVAMGVGGGAELTPAPGATLPPAVGDTPTPVPTLPPPPTPTPPGCPSPYTVKQGDWIYKIARDCHVEPSAIVAANPGINPNFISPGQQLNMPGAGATAVPPATPQACKGAYTVKQGDNLFRIAYNRGLTTEQLARLNGVVFPYTLHPGDVLKFP